MEVARPEVNGDLRKTVSRRLLLDIRINRDARHLRNGVRYIYSADVIWTNLLMAELDTITLENVNKKNLNEVELTTPISESKSQL